MLRTAFVACLVVLTGCSPPAGPDDADGAFAPDRRHLAVGFDRTCALGVNQGWSCFGPPNPSMLADHPTYLPAADADWVFMADPSIVCRLDDRMEPTQGETCRAHTCGLDPEGRIACLGPSLHGLTRPPRGQFRRISVEASIGCGVGWDGALYCWGGKNARVRDVEGMLTPPDGTDFVDVQVLSTRRFRDGDGEWVEAWACAHREDGTLSCWGNADHGRLDAPDVAFTQFSLHARGGCGVDAAQTVTCWGEGDPEGFSDVGLTSLEQLQQLGEGAAESIHLAWYTDGVATGCSTYDGGYAICGTPWEERAPFEYGGPGNPAYHRIAIRTFHGCGILAETDALRCWGEPERVDGHEDGAGDRIVPEDG